LLDIKFRSKRSSHSAKLQQLFTIDLYFQCGLLLGSTRAFKTISLNTKVG
jgi:hypothetical protein